MGLLDKRAADWTARDAVDVWVWSVILGNIFKILLVIPLIFKRMPKKDTRTAAERKQGSDDYRKKLRQEQLYRDLGL